MVTIGFHLVDAARPRQRGAMCKVLATARSLGVTKIGVMARTVSVVMTDDLDGSPGAETVQFVLDGVSYEIDLGKANRAKLGTAFAPYIQAGRRVSRSGRRRAVGRPAAERVDRAAVRAWAREAGLAVSERGRISAEVMHQYEDAH